MDLHATALPRPSRRSEPNVRSPVERPLADRAALRLHVVPGHAGAVWRALVDAWADGADEDALAVAVYVTAPAPRSWVNLLDRHLQLLRAHAAALGMTIARVPKSEPRRWCLHAAEAGPEPDAPASSAPAPTAMPRAVAPRLSFAALAPVVIEGPLGALKARDCRWPIGDVGDEDFRFCCAPAVEGSRMPYCAAHRLVARDRPAPLRRVA